MEFQQSGERDINKKTWKHCGGRGILLSPSGNCSIFFLATNSLRVLNFYSFTTTNFLPSTKTICSKIFLLTSFSVFSVFYFLHLSIQHYMSHLLPYNYLFPGFLGFSSTSLIIFCPLPPKDKQFPNLHFPFTL